MKRNTCEIELEIPNSGIFTISLENENLIISLDLAKFEYKKKLNAGGLAKPLHPYIIYEVLEKNNKNTFNDVKIIDKIEDENNIIYHFNFGLILNTFIGENKDNKDKEALKALSFMQNFIPACFFSYQIIGDSKAIPKNVLEDLKNRYGYEGKNYKSIFKKEVYINCNCLERLNFSHCEFESKVSLRFLKDNKYKEFHNGVNFSNCIFKNEVDFSYFVSGAPLPNNKYYNNAQNTLFKDCIFENKVDFHNSKITNNIYFNNAHFKDYVDFHECEFEKTASFYGVRFDKAPNFSACYFKEPKAVNLINVDIDKLDFKSLEQYIKDKYQDETYENKQELTEEQRNNNCKLKCAKHLKDSFRVIKDVLITQNNTLEAQEWHKLELYAKEKENHINLNVKEREKNTDIFKNILIWFNCVLLNVYRNTSDHHNDFLKILNFTIGMIALYGVFFYLLLEVYMYLDIIFIESFFRFKIIDYIYLCLFVFLTIIMFLYKNKKSIFTKSILFLTIYITFYIVYIKILNFINITYFREWFFYLLCYIIGIYIFYLAFIFISKFKFINFILKLCIYLAFLSIWILSSNFINPFTGVFSSDKLYESQFEKSLNDLNASVIINLASILQNDFNLHLKDQNISFTELNSAKASIIANKENLLKLNDVNSNIAKEVLGEKYTELLKTINQDKIIENIIKSTSVLYGIILLLCIFSLQKTARKNSIVPS
ncbi:TPA: pentapeptide repeat-containing protein [Campylobacter coli]|nr:pentapeptide repeat-containing protein [Campylobacter coli]MCE4869332.1 pentapeptide repeat-containing protein [Campylobacter coli]MCE4872361.1 pentapeptide repeat-containing protein [Campylobacter coli]MCH3713498.1 pentapeptide repeat-containing protein [Campylobacter coli]MCH3715452.1 pentapeptide repeat-containing protein [Campylobacter coli]MCH3725460.1 pentapeptide repeat-containing protein [Campylobacter coli]